MKQFFLTRSRREQLLVTLLVVLTGVIWAAYGFGRTRTQFGVWRSLRTDHALQQRWLDRKTQIDAGTAEAVKTLDPKQTLDPTRLIAQISALAAEAGVTANTEPPKTTNASQLAVHTVQVTCRRASLASLIKFYEGIQGKSPYLVLEQCSLLIERGTAGVLSASFQISSVEVAAPPAAH